MTIQELVRLAQPFAQTLPILDKWGPALDALIELLESGKLTQDAALEMMKNAMLNASDAEMHRELDV